MTILYFIIVFCMCITRFNIIMTLVGGPLTRIDAVNMIPFHSIRENLKYGHSPISWDMLYNIVMFVPFGIIYCYYQKTFCIYKAIGLSVLTTFSIEIAQFILKTGVVDIDDLIVNTIGSLVGIFFYIALQKILQRAQMLDVHEVIDTVATIADESVLNIDEDGDGKYDLKLRATKNSYGEKVETYIWIYVVAGCSAFLLLFTSIIVIKNKRNKKQNKNKGER